MICQECGMDVTPGEYHPYGACLMFMACQNSTVVTENLRAIQEHGSRRGNGCTHCKGTGRVRGLARGTKICPKCKGRE